MGNDERFYKFNPISDAEQSGYEEALNFVFKDGNEDIRNVGITGAYGTGKSTVIRSYEKKSGRHFLYVSVADFSKPTDENTINIGVPQKKHSIVAGNVPIRTGDISIGNTPEDDYDAQTQINNTNGCKRGTNEIESEIINVLLHKLPYETISRTRFPLKRRCTDGELIVKASILLYALLYFVFTFFPTKFPIPALPCACLDTIIRYATFIGFVLALLYWTEKILSYFYRYNPIQRVSLKGNEIELGNKSISHFDENLDELIYLYYESNIDVFVFEDLDRFENIEIFERLRYINELLNECAENQKKKRVIRFFYLVRDELLGFDKTKFFDFIVPVVPFVSFENAYEKVKARLDDLDLEIDDYLLRGTFAFISDYRLILNIINEFLVYEKNLSGIEIDKLFALMVYKNVFPEDYTKLKDNAGCLYSHLSYIREGYSQKEKPLVADSEAEEDDWSEEINKLTQNENERQLVRFLLRNGYIDESYPEYISKYDGIRMSETDRQFYMSLFTEKRLPPDYKLDNPEYIINRLRVSDFKKQSLLNYNVLYFLIISINLEEQRDAVLDQIITAKNVGFLAGFLKWTVDKTDIDDKSEIIHIICRRWPNLFALYEKNSQLNDVACYFLKYGRYSVYSLANENDQFKTYLENNICVFEQLNLNNEEEDAFEDGLSSLNIRLSNFDLRRVENNVGEIIIGTNSFETDANNLEQFMGYYSEISNDKPLARFNVLPETVRNQYLKNQLATYTALLKEGTRYCDEEEDIIKFLNDSEVDAAIREKYVKNMANTILDAEAIIDLDILHLVSKYNRLEPTLVNLIYIFNKLVLGTGKHNLPEYLELINTISEEEYEQYSEDVCSDLYSALSVIKGIKKDIYRVIVKKRGQIVAAPKPLSALTEEQYAVLIEERLLDANMENFVYVYANFPKEKMILLENYCSVFLQCIGSARISVSAKDLVEIMDYDISEENKISILSSVKCEIPIKNTYSNEVKIRLLGRVESISSILELLNVYKQQINDVKYQLLICLKRLVTQIGDNTELPYEVTYDLVRQFQVKLPPKTLAKCVRTYAKWQVKRIFGLEPDNVYLRCMEEKKLVDGMGEDIVTDALRERKWIK